MDLLLVNRVVLPRAGAHWHRGHFFLGRGSRDDLDQCETFLHQAERLGEADRDCGVVLRGDVVNEVEHRNVEVALCGGALIGLNNIGGGDWSSIRELRVITQRYFVLGV